MENTVNPDYDIVYDRDDLRFSYRVVGIGLDRGRVLLQQIVGTDWWFMPGGRCTLGEPAQDTLKREMLEELNAEVEIGRLVWLVENFFTMDSRSYHELALFFLINFSGDSPVLKAVEMKGTDHGASGNLVSVLNRWHRLDGLGDVPLYPSFLRAGLRNIPDTTVHILHRDT
jgi:8-oxo-dGTP pyrophosphatase MutT (NUDIX family)